MTEITEYTDLGEQYRIADPAALLQLVMGAFDILFHHELIEWLSWCRDSRRELRLYALRNPLYAVIFLGLGGRRGRAGWPGFS